MENNPLYMGIKARCACQFNSVIKLLVITVVQVPHSDDVSALADISPGYFKSFVPTPSTSHTIFCLHVWSLTWGYESSSVRSHAACPTSAVSRPCCTPCSRWADPCPFLSTPKDLSYLIPRALFIQRGMSVHSRHTRTLMVRSFFPFCLTSRLSFRRFSCDGAEVVILYLVSSSLLYSASRVHC